MHTKKIKTLQVVPENFVKIDVKMIGQIHRISEACKPKWWTNNKDKLIE